MYKLTPEQRLFVEQAVAEGYTLGMIADTLGLSWPQFVALRREHPALDSAIIAAEEAYASDRAELIKTRQRQMDYVRDYANDDAVRYATAHQLVDAHNTRRQALEEWFAAVKLVEEARLWAAALPLGSTAIKNYAPDRPTTPITGDDVRRMVEGA